RRAVPAYRQRQSRSARAEVAEASVTIRFHGRFNALARRAIDVEHVGDRLWRRETCFFKGFFDTRGDIGEADGAGEEAGDRDFVSGVEDDWRGPAGFERLPREPKRREAPRVRRLEL